MTTPQEMGFVSNLCGKISKFGIYALAFLLPIFFLPFTRNVLDFNKQALLILIGVISAFALLIKILISEKAEFVSSPAHFFVALFLLLSVLALFFSVSFSESFWGRPNTISESLVSLAFLVIFYFLVLALTGKKGIVNFVFLLVLSFTLAEILGIFQIFGRFLLPFSFAKTMSFNTVGGIFDLALIAAILAPLKLVLAIKSEKFYFKILFWFAAIVSVLLLSAVNFQLAWLLAAFGFFVLIALAAIEKEYLGGKWLIVPAIFLISFLFLGFLKIQLPGFPANISEVYLTQPVGFDIALKSVMEKPFFGFGPGNFVYSFEKNKNASFNLNPSPYWSASFEKSSSKFFDAFSGSGILGGAAFLLMNISVPFFVLWKIFAGSDFALFSFIKKWKKQPAKKIKIAEQGATLGEGAVNQAEKPSSDANRFLRILGFGSLSVFISLVVLDFFWPSNLSLEFLRFSLMAILVFIFCKKRKEFLLKPASLATVSLNIAFALVFVFGFGVLIFAGQNYVAEAAYAKSASDWLKGDFSSAKSNLETAIKINPKYDFYWTELSQLYLKEISYSLARTDISKNDAMKQAQSYLTGAVNAAKNATALNPNNSVNWINSGSVYQGLIGAANSAIDLSVASYEEAERLDPNNPEIPFQIGVSYLKQAEFLSRQKQNDQALAMFSQSEALFNDAIKLKANYSDAYFNLSLVYQDQGKINDAITQLQIAKSLDPYNARIYFSLGFLYYGQKDYKSAQAELENAVLLSPDYSNALYYLGFTYYQLEEDDKAIEAIKKVVALNPDAQEPRTVLNNLNSGKDIFSGISAASLAPVTPETPGNQATPSSTSGSSGSLIPTPTPKPTTNPKAK